MMKKDGKKILKICELSLINWLIVASRILWNWKINSSMFNKKFMKKFGFIWFLELKVANFPFISVV